MNVAFLFNSNHPQLGGYYGPPVMNAILGAGVLQRVQRHMRISVGDILTFMAISESKDRTYENLVRLCRRVYTPDKFDKLSKIRLEDTFTSATVYCWLFQNITEEIAESLHKALGSFDPYLGAMDVDFASPFHLAFFRNKLVEIYRLHGLQCSVFFAMGDNEDPDIAVREAFEKHGFSVDDEDIGARRTIFDDFDGLEHFQRVGAFTKMCSSLPNLTHDDASDLSYNLEELHPKLFDSFASAARTFERAETEEDYAQVAISGRRLMEKTADYLFPPQKELWKGRNVWIPHFKNRLWAYIEQTLEEQPKTELNTLEILGKEADRLLDVFNAALHSDVTREKVELGFRDLVIWLSKLIMLNPAAARRPYLAYEKGIENMFKDLGNA